MISSRNPMKNQVAFAGAATTGMVKRNTERTQLSLAAEACIDVLRQCGLGPNDVDGMCGTTPSAEQLQASLGLTEITWFANPVMPFINQVASASAAVAAGLCEVCLLWHGAYRLPWNTSASLKDPYRAVGLPTAPPSPDNVANAIGYTAWASRYLYEYGASKEDFGLIAINDRSNAARNPAAAITDPLTMDDYLASRMVRWPLCVLDMDIAVDGADAFVITTTERARDMPLPPALINAVTLGMVANHEEDQIDGLHHHGQHVVIEALRAKSDFWIDGTDVYFPYDGFSVIALSWIENVGWCGPGEAGDFMRQHWDDETNSIRVDGRIPFNPHGGSLSEGATQGSGHVREAVHQLQGLAGDRQVPDARTALLTPGGFFFNAQGLTLLRE
jgi:acetyl-CoA acetyltransferase